MKTTLDLNDALHARAKSEAARRKIPLTRLIEEALSRQLEGFARAAGARKPFEVKPRPLGLRPAYYGTSLNQLYDQFEAEAAPSGKAR